MNSELHSTYSTHYGRSKHLQSEAAVTAWPWLRPELPGDRRARSVFSSYLSVFRVKASTFPPVTSNKKCVRPAARTEREKEGGRDWESQVYVKLISEESHLLWNASY